MHPQPSDIDPYDLLTGLRFDRAIPFQLARQTESRRLIPNYVVSFVDNTKDYANRKASSVVYAQHVVFGRVLSPILCINSTLIPD